MASLSARELALLKNRDADYLSRIFEEINPSLFKLLASNQIFNESAKEIVQESWKTFFESLDRFEGRSQVKTYIIGIVINKMREHRRFYKRMNSEEDIEEVINRGFDSNGWWNREPPDPHQLLQSSEILGHIAECLEGLTMNQRDAFILKEVDQQKTSEICNILNVTITHLGVLIYRAKEKLRLCLEGKVELK